MGKGPGGLSLNLANAVNVGVKFNLTFSLKPATMSIHVPLPVLRGAFIQLSRPTRGIQSMFKVYRFGCQVYFINAFNSAVEHFEITKFQIQNVSTLVTETF